MIQETSLNAWIEVQPTLTGRRLQVYDVLMSRGPLTNAEIGRLIHLPINCVTPRVNELRKKNLVRHFEVRQCSVTGHNAIAWKCIL